jgi:excisionase family DNA binding protein
MINGDAIAQIVLEWGKPTLSGDRLIVPTFATYPSNSLVQAYVEGGRDRFVVSDGGGALKVVLGMGSASHTVHKLLSSFAKGTSVKVNSSGWIFLGGVTLKNLTSAISIVAEASREAAVLLLKHFNPKPAIDFRRDRWMSVEEIAGYLGASKDTIYGWITKRDMPAHKVGRLWKFKSDEVDSWARAGKASDEGDHAVSDAKRRERRATRGSNE